MTSQAPSPISKVFLKPGELFITFEPTIISTVLGSCISLTMFDPHLRMGGMCHALLPTGEAASGSDAFRFVDNAILYMIDRFIMAGIKRSRIEAKLFGGSDVLGTIGGEGAPATVGTQNVQKAREIMEKERVPVLAEDVRGEEGRKILFHTHTGNILLKRIRKTELYGAIYEKDQGPHSR